nr:MAG TPA: baseplate protein [Caudoviricetes sp.]
MSDYISRKAAVKIAQKYGLANGSALGRHTGLADCIAIEIEGLPAADVEPVRHGEWLRTDDDWSSLVTIQCSACGGEWCFEVDEDVQLLGYNYRPGCGCKMDLEDETNDD